MGVTEIFALLGGLALFLYGMQMMSDGLEAAAGDKMKSILEKLTSNRFLAVAVGAVITAVIQSSSATTVMVVGFVNTGLMSLSQAVWIIMGANIGTTITGQLIALDVGAAAPLIAFIGVAMIVFLKMPKVQHIGKIAAGLGVLFIGMDMMGGSMEPLKESESFISIMTEFSNPALGILAGAVFTAVIQSSSASVGILQTLANEGLIAFDSAAFVLFGQNIGTCITAVLASIGTNRSAKRTTIIHLLFNIIGTAIFTTLCLLLPVTDWVKSISPDLPASQIANMHTVFNVATTLILIPFGNYLAKFAEKILPDTESKNQTSTISVLSDEFRRGRISLGSSAVHIDVLKQEIDRMITLVGQNTEMCYHTVIESDKTMLQEVEKNEEVIDTMNKEISQYISRILVNNKIGHSVEDIEEYFLITGNAERIGDHAVNIAGYIEVINRKSIVFSEEARSELAEMQSISKQTIEKLLNRSEAPEKWLSRVAALEQKIDDMTSAYREKHLERMRQGKCTEEACVLYSELLTDFERIGDHALNIAQCFSKIHAKV
ncbi:MAG: Na/Pi cotransporter family protein [Ruminococcus sp.]|nr:Na/Pi cotransporter family protein [Ruminococcus sp.]